MLLFDAVFNVESLIMKAEAPNWTNSLSGIAPSALVFDLILALLFSSPCFQSSHCRTFTDELSEHPFVLVELGKPAS